MQRHFIQSHDPIPFHFRQTKENFTVDEVPLVEPSGKGNYLWLHLEKRDLSTLEMLTLLEKETGCKSIGYAGLKDKSATTTQYCSIPLKFTKNLKRFNHPKITLLSSRRHGEKLSLGDLKGNRFRIRLESVSPESAERLERVLDDIVRNGMPNYFGYQRFGRESGNIEKARDVAHAETDMRDKKLQRLLTSAYQSHLFNAWLAERIHLSRTIDALSPEGLAKKFGFSPAEADALKNQPWLFRVLPGDVMVDTVTGRWVNVTDLQSVRKPVKERKLIPTGLMAGKKAWRAKGFAATVEERYDDLLVQARGERRAAWVYPAKITSNYDKESQIFELAFTLPRGAYATVLLENLANRDLTPKSDNR